MEQVEQYRTARNQSIVVWMSVIQKHATDAKLED